MEKVLNKEDFAISKSGYVVGKPQLSSTLHANCYTDEKYFAVEAVRYFAENLAMGLP